jgi:hypothetical protein
VPAIRKLAVQVSGDYGKTWHDGAEGNGRDRYQFLPIGLMQP